MNDLATALIKIKEILNSVSIEQNEQISNINNETSLDTTTKTLDMMYKIHYMEDDELYHYFDYEPFRVYYHFISPKEIEVFKINDTNLSYGLSMKIDVIAISDTEFRKKLIEFVHCIVIPHYKIQLWNGSRGGN